MSSDLSPQNLEYLRQMVAGGEFTTVGAALDAAVDALRRENEKLPKVPDEHMDAVEEVLAELEAGTQKEEEMTANDWDELRQVARDAAAKKSRVG